MSKKIIIEIKNIIGCVFGTFIMSLGTVLFLLPNKLSSGGFSGIGTILYYFFGINLGTSTIILNIPILFISYFKLGKLYVLKSIISIVTLSYFYDLFLKIPINIQDSFLACIYGGIIIGIGLAIVFKMDASTGGSDLLASLLKSKIKRFSTSEILLFIDASIISLNILFFKKIEIGLYSFITIYIVGKMVDLFFEGINFCKKIYIISEDTEKISKRIINEMGKGITGIYGKGMYKHTESLILLCVVKKRELPKLMKIVKEIDENAFLIISDAREVYGLGFKESF